MYSDPPKTNKENSAFCLRNQFTPFVTVYTSPPAWNERCVNGSLFRGRAQFSNFMATPGFRTAAMSTGDYRQEHGWWIYHRLRLEVVHLWWYSWMFPGKFQLPTHCKRVLSLQLLVIDDWWLAVIGFTDKVFTFLTWLVVQFRRAGGSHPARSVHDSRHRIFPIMIRFHIGNDNLT